LKTFKNICHLEFGASSLSCQQQSVCPISVVAFLPVRDIELCKARHRSCVSPRRYITLVLCCIVFYVWLQSLILFYVTFLFSQWSKQTFDYSQLSSVFIFLGSSQRIKRISYYRTLGPVESIQCAVLPLYLMQFKYSKTGKCSCHICLSFVAQFYVSTNWLLPQL
jgi:hypothetical protein